MIIIKIMEIVLKKTFFALSVSLVIVRAADMSWSYTGTNDGADTWGSSWATCDPKTNPRQSPINIQNTIYDPNLRMPVLHPEYWLPQNVTLVNKGLSVDIQFPNPNILIDFMDKGVERQYRLIGGHFHWGTKDKPGAEHLVDGKQYKADLHMVHFATDVDPEKVMETPDAILVIGVFIEEIDGPHANDNSNYTSLFDHLQHIQKPESQYTMTIIPGQLLPTDATFTGNMEDSRMYHYYGGLTTPACYGVVNWVVMGHTIQLSHDWVNHDFYDIGPWQKVGDDYIPQGGNFRPIQDIGNRKIWTNIPDNSGHRNTLRLSWLVCLVAIFTVFQ